MIAAILRAQLLSMRIAARGTRLGVITQVIWYGIWIGLSALVYVSASLLPREEIDAALPMAFLALFFYWQFVPVFAASMGAGLDMRKLQVYPVPHAKLFQVELLLRLVSGLEMLMVLTAGTAALWRRYPWIVPAVLLFIAFNVFLASGLRSVFERLLARRRVREFVGLFFVMLYAVPRLMFYSGAKVGAPALRVSGTVFLLVLSVSAVLAFWFGRTQFERNLRFDAMAAQATPAGEVAPWKERLYRLPSLVFRDPLAAIVEKELRTLIRAPRFRMVFIMGFTFGLVVWFPLFMGHRNPQYLLIIMSIYALTLLGQVSYWNCFGLDRSAAALYFAAPQPIRQAIVGKNIAAMVFVYLEVLVLAAVTALLRLVSGRTIETLLVVGVCSLYMLGVGNLSSVHYPRGITAERVSSSGGGGVQGLLFLLYPLVLVPVFLAYVARWALDSELAFALVLAIAAVIGGVVYAIALESAVSAANRRREQILQALSAGEGPVAV